MSYDNNQADEFLEEYDPLILIGADDDGFGVKICQDLDLETLATC